MSQTRCSSVDVLPLENFPRSALSRLDRALQIALEVLRGVLAGEVAIAALLLLGAREAGVLPDLPVGVRALRPLVAGPVVARRAAVPLVGRARQNRLDLRQEVLRHLRGDRAAPDRRAGIAARVPDEHA